MTRLTAGPGEILPLTDGAVVTFYQIDAGELTYYATSGTTTYEGRWPAGEIAGKAEYDPEVTHEVRLTSDTPAVVLELAVFPSASATPAGEDD